MSTAQKLGLTALAVLPLLLTACGETGSKAVKAAAKAIAEDDETPAQTAQPAPAAQPVVQQGFDQQAIQAQQQPAFPQDTYATDTAVPVGSLPPKPVQQPVQQPQAAERVVRHRATVLTQYGGKVIVRQSPSKNGRKLGFLYDREEVFVIGETNRCETINGLYGCWVKVVDSVGLSGYSFGAYLNY